MLCLIFIFLTELSELIGVFTPIILLVWFLYSQWQTLSKNYYEEINGLYAGFTDAISNTKEEGTIYSGIILNIRDTDSKGFFKGEFDFGETLSATFNDRPAFRDLRRGIFTFLGKLNYSFYLNKTRHPYKPDENRTYLGKLYITDRLDFKFDDLDIENFLSAEYDIVHYREMKTLKFTLSKTFKRDRPELPESFTLFKSFGLGFEPYKNIKEIVFFDRTFSDR